MLRHVDMRGGIGVYTRELLTQMIPSYPQHTFFLYFESEEQADRFRTYPNAVSRVIVAPVKLLWDQLLVPRAAAGDRVDVLYNPKLSTPVMSSVPSVFVFHGPEMFEVPEAYGWTDRTQARLLYRRYAAAAAATIVSTPDAKIKAVKYLGVRSELVHVVPPGRSLNMVPAPQERQCAVIKQHNLPDEFFLFVGGLYPIKNFGRILQAMAQLRDELGEATPPLVAVGFRRWRMDDELRMIEEAGLSDLIIFPGYVEDDELAALYSACRAFVFPSLYEGFGLAALEALSCGAPLITSDRGGTAEIGKDGAAILIDPYDVNELADQMLAVHQDARLRQALSTRGILRAQEFGWDRMAKQVIDVFDAVTQARGRKNTRARLWG